MANPHDDQLSAIHKLRHNGELLILIRRVGLNLHMRWHNVKSDSASGAAHYLRKIDSRELFALSEWESR